jgi:demethylmenaquinone methyltransferase/2-methoxy-6-polyprenyl-1,4-benzoquinol methylase
MNVEHITPYDSGERKRLQMTRAFDIIAHRYDRLNRILSFGIDLGWRRRALRLLAGGAPEDRPAHLLDVATGTADFAIMAARRLPRARLTGIDLSEGMLRAGRAKVAAAKLDARIALASGDGLALPYADGTFDAVTSAFGVRNFEDIPAGLAEMRRVLCPGGRVLILELSQPEHFPMRPLFRFYMRTLMPLLSGFLSGHAREYRYLPASITHVPQGEAMLALLRTAGFSDCRRETYTFGICSCYTAQAEQTDHRAMHH